MYGRVYYVRNKLSGKLYIGITTSTLRARWGSHCREAASGARRWLLHRAMAKYGIDNFEISVLEECEDRASLHEAECRWIANKRSFAPAGYNMTLGGGGVSGFKRSEEFKRQVSARFLGRTVPEKTRKRMSEAKAGKRCSDKCYEASIAWSTGRARPPEVRAKIGAGNKGKKLSANHIEFLRRFKTGTKLSQKGKEAISRPVIADWVEYSSLKSASAALGASVSVINRRILRSVDGYSLISAPRRRRNRTPEQIQKMRLMASRPVFAAGKRYASITDAAHDIGITRQGVAYRINVNHPGYWVIGNDHNEDRADSQGFGDYNCGNAIAGGS